MASDSMRPQGQPPPKNLAPTGGSEPKVHDEAATGVAHGLPPLPRHARHPSSDGVSPQRKGAEAPNPQGQRVGFLFWASLASLFGLAIGLALAILLASGELDLSLKDVKLIFKSLNVLRS